MNLHDITSRIIASKFVQRILWVMGVSIAALVIVDSFVMPWYVNKGGTLIVPNVVGLKEEEAFKLLQTYNLEPRSGDVRFDDKYPEGYVVSQNPPAEQIVKVGRRVYVTISGGEQQAIVPSLRGRTLRDSKFSLDRAGLRQGGIRYQTSNDLPEGTIISQDIPNGAKIKRGSYIGIVVSAGASIDSIYVPMLVGKTLTEARKILKIKGLKVGSITYQRNQELLPNTIIDQLPRSDDIVTVDKEVDLFVAQTPEKK